MSSSTGRNSTGKPGGGAGGGNNSAWSRPLNNRGRIGNNSGTVNSGAAATVGGSGRSNGVPPKHRPPPGLESGFGGGKKTGGISISNSKNDRGSSGGGDETVFGWGNRGGGGSSTNDNNNNSSTNNGYVKKSVHTASTADNTAANISNNSNSSNNNNNTHNQAFVLRERFLHLILSMVGQTVILTATDGQVLEGVFHTFTPFNSLQREMRNVYVLKACRDVTKGGRQSEKVAEVEEGSTVVFPAHKVLSVQAKAMRLDTCGAETKTSTTHAVNNDASAFGTEDSLLQTDSQISGRKGGGKTLVAAGSVWTSAGDGSDSANDAFAVKGGLGGGPLESSVGEGLAAARASKGGADTSLNWRRAAAPSAAAAASRANSSAPDNNSSMAAVGGGGIATKGKGGLLSGSIGDWDQFSVNESRFNVRATYDENLYTTSLDVSNVDKAKIADAERMAHEIESTVSSNIHIAEERGQKPERGDYDEEDLYSGVLTKELKARVMPTAAADKTVDESKEEDKQAVPKKQVMNYAAAAKKDQGRTSPVSSTAGGAGAMKSTDKSAGPQGKTQSPLPATLVKPEEKKAELQDNKYGEDSSKEATCNKAHKNDTTATTKDEAEKREPDKDNKKSSGPPAATTTSKLKLNPKAKAFSFNPTAPAWAPPAAAAPAPMPPQTPMEMPQPSPPYPSPHGDYQGGGGGGQHPGMSMGALPGGSLGFAPMGEHLPVSFCSLSFCAIFV